MTEETINNNYKIYGVNYKEDPEKAKEIIEKKDWNMVLRFLIFTNMP
jgi:hypothetical protein